MILSYNGVLPRIGKDVFIAPTAVVIGDVTLNDGVSVWFNAVVRGDMAPIKIGINSNIQDNCTVHTDHNCPVTIGDNVTIGHNAIIHGCVIANNVLVGMSSTILNNAFIDEFSIIAAGAIVLENQSVGPSQLVAGTPAVCKKNLPRNIINVMNQAVKDYTELSVDYRAEK